MIKVAKKRVSSTKRAKNSWISGKIQKIMHEGVRKNTHRPVSSANPRRKVSQKMAEAIAESMYGRRGKKKKNSGSRRKKSR